MKNIFYYSLVLGLCLCFSSCKKDDSKPDPITQVADVDGNVYKVVTIENQIWMAENLRTTKYSNGEAINNITDDTKWSQDTAGAYCWYDNDIDRKAYGALYNWNAISADLNQGRNICPDGWHVPTHYEFNNLVDSIGVSASAGGKLKSRNKWAAPNTGATDQYLFAAIPTGYRNTDGSFSGKDSITDLWTSTENLQHKAPYMRTLSYDSEAFTQHQVQRTFGYAVRCIKD